MRLNKARRDFSTSTCGLVAMTSASHAEGRQFDPGQVYIIYIRYVIAHSLHWHFFFSSLSISLYFSFSLDVCTVVGFDACLLICMGLIVDLLTLEDSQRLK